MSQAFQSLSLYDWRQFENVELDLTRPLTVLTGANGAGKTTILNVLTQQFGWAAQFVAEPSLDRGALRFLNGWRRRMRARFGSGEDEPTHQIGVLEYSDGTTTDLYLPADGGAVFNINYSRSIQVQGLYVPSHRPSSAYQQVTTIPTAVTSPEEFIESYENELRYRWQGQHTNYSATYRLKESLIALATFGWGKQVVEPNPEYAQAFEGFQNVLGKVLPRSLGFQHLKVAIPEVVLVTDTGRFSLDAMSGGVAALVDLAWRIFMRARRQPGLVVVIDEPENHLHPELQRELLPGLLTAFPDIQLIVATHSPFIVGSVRDSNVYVLRYNADKRVESTLLDTVNKAGSSNEILRDVLGLDFTMPLWVEDGLIAVVRRYENQPVTHDSLQAMRAELKEFGLSHLFPNAVSSVLEEQDDPA